MLTALKKSQSLLLHHLMNHDTSNALSSHKNTRTKWRRILWTFLKKKIGASRFREEACLENKLDPYGG
jgi:hypothetical protein